MSDLHFPLVTGVDQAIDPKLLPSGALSVLTDARIRKPGKIGPRNGYTAAPFYNAGFDAVASAEFKKGFTITINDRTSILVAPRFAIAVATTSGTGAYKDAPRFMSSGGNLYHNSSLSTVGGVRRQRLSVPSFTGSASSTCAAAGKYIVAAHCDADVLGGTATPTAAIYTTTLDAATMVILGESKLLAGGASAITNPHLVAIGTTILLFATFGSEIRACALDTNSATDPQFNDATWTVVVTATSATAAKRYHVATYDGTNCVLCFQSGATTLEWGYVTAAKAYTSKATQTVTNTVRPCICRVGNGSSDVAIIWADGATHDTGNCSYGTWNSAGTVVTGATSLDATGEVSGYPLIAPAAATGGVTLVWSNNRGPTGTNANRTTLRNASGSVSNIVYDMVPASLPFSFGNGHYIWMADASKTKSGGSALGFGTYRLLDARDESAGSQGPGGLSVQAVAAGLKALPARYLFGVSDVNDNRRECCTAPSQSPMPGLSASATVLPVLGADGIFVPEIVYVETGNLAERLLTTFAQGQLMFSGGAIATYDGSLFTQSGLFNGPAEIYAIDGGLVGSGLDAGTYQYVAVWEWVDALGQRTFSAPSNPVTITVAANHRVQLIATTTPPSSIRGAALFISTQISLRWYRTLAGESVFHSISDSASTARTNDDWAGSATLYDIATDAAIRDNETLYTQGERGGLSGLLQNDEPPAAKFICVGSDRVMLTGLETPQVAQFSKLMFPGEPVQWTSSESHQVSVDDVVTAGAFLDGVWFVFSANAIWAITGVGPDDSGQGSFESPRRLPSPVGCLSGRSLVETRDGLMFQAAAGIYLLPRGGGAPTWIGEAVQDTLESYPIVTASFFDPDERIAYFGCCNSGGSQGVLLAYDVEHGQWSVDTVQNTVIKTIGRFNGQLLLNGAFLQASGAWKDDFTGAQDFPVSTVTTTGDIRPYGVLGHGFTAKVAFLGEHRSASNSTMTVEESTDSGTSWTTIGTFTMAGTAGTPFRRECLCKRPRGETFRFRVTMTPSASTIEAPVINSVSLEVFKYEGTARMASAERA